MHNSFVFKISRGVYSVPFGEIIFMEKQKRQMLLHTKEKEHLFYAAFDEIMPRLDERFMRCHRSYIINMDHVRTMNRGRIVMSNGSVIMMGSKSFRRTLQGFEEYLRRNLNGQR